MKPTNSRPKPSPPNPPNCPPCCWAPVLPRLADHPARRRPARRHGLQRHPGPARRPDARRQPRLTTSIHAPPRATDGAPAGARFFSGNLPARALQPCVSSSLLLIAVLLAGCNDTTGQSVAAPAGGDFVLQSADGPVDTTALRGKVLLVYFGYTNCPDICPASMAADAQALNALSAEERAKTVVMHGLASTPTATRRRSSRSTPRSSIPT